MARLCGYSRMADQMTRGGAEVASPLFDSVQTSAVLVTLGGGEVLLVFGLTADATDGEGRRPQTIARDEASAHLADAVSLVVDGTQGIIDGVEAGVLFIGTAEIRRAREGVGTILFHVLLVRAAERIGARGAELAQDGFPVGEEAFAEVREVGVAEMLLAIFGEAGARAGTLFPRGTHQVVLGADWQGRFTGSGSAFLRGNFFDHRRLGGFLGGNFPQGSFFSYFFFEGVFALGAAGFFAGAFLATAALTALAGAFFTGVTLATAFAGAFFAAGALATAALTALAGAFFTGVALATTFAGAFFAAGALATFAGVVFAGVFLATAALTALTGVFFAGVALAVALVGAFLATAALTALVGVFFAGVTLVTVFAGAFLAGVALAFFFGAGCFAAGDFLGVAITDSISLKLPEYRDGSAITARIQTLEMSGNLPKRRLRGKHASARP